MNSVVVPVQGLFRTTGRAWEYWFRAPRHLPALPNSVAAFWAAPFARRLLSGMECSPCVSTGRVKQFNLLPQRMLADELAPRRLLRSVIRHGCVKVRLPG